MFRIIEPWVLLDSGYCIRVSQPISVSIFLAPNFAIQQLQQNRVWVQTWTDVKSYWKFKSEALQSAENACCQYVPWFHGEAICDSYSGDTVYVCLFHALLAYAHLDLFELWLKNHIYDKLSFEWPNLNGHSFCGICSLYQKWNFFCIKGAFQKKHI